jgi:hypothetical protein
MCKKPKKRPTPHRFPTLVSSRSGSKGQRIAFFSQSSIMDSPSRMKKYSFVSNISGKLASLQVIIFTIINFEDDPETMRWFIIPDFSPIFWYLERAHQTS